MEWRPFVWSTTPLFGIGFVGNLCQKLFSDENDRKSNWIEPTSESRGEIVEFQTEIGSVKCNILQRIPSRMFSSWAQNTFVPMFGLEIIIYKFKQIHFETRQSTLGNWNLIFQAGSDGILASWTFLCGNFQKSIGAGSTERLQWNNVWGTIHEFMKGYMGFR